MLQKEKTQRYGHNYYLLGKSNNGHGLVYLRETDDEYELVYKNENGFFNEINTFGGYRLHAPGEIYEILNETVITDEYEFYNRMFEYHIAIAARNISHCFGRFTNNDVYQHFEGIAKQVRAEIAKIMSPDDENEWLYNISIFYNNNHHNINT